MTTPIEQQEEFGFLSIDRDIVFKGGGVYRLPTWASATALVDEEKHQDGFIYPPMSVTRRRIDTGDLSDPKQARWEPLPKTRRPALLHPLPMSHLLTIDEPPLNETFDRNDGAFLLHLLAYLFGTRLHFRRWWVDGRIPTTGTHQLLPTPKSEVAFLSHSYQTWRSWPEEERRWMTNILYMNSRSPCHEWDWERFTINYMVFDAIYKLSTRIAGVPDRGVKHHERYDKLRAAFGLADDRDVFATIIELRNNLFHQALWDGKLPGEGGVSEKAWWSVELLRRINHRLIPALLGFPTSYTGVSCRVSDGCLL